MLVDLASVPFAEVLFRALAQRLTGELYVRRGRAVKALFLDDGVLAFAASNLKADRLGEVLVALGRLSQGEMAETAQLMRRRQRRLRFGEALAASGLMSTREVGSALARQMESIVLSLFPVTDAIVSIDARPCPIPSEYRVELSLHRLLYEGIRSMSDPTRIEFGITAADADVELARVCPFPFSLQRCSSEEYAILEAARHPVPLAELLEGSEDPFERWRAVHALLASGVLIESSHPARGSGTGRSHAAA